MSLALHFSSMVMVLFSACAHPPPPGGGPEREIVQQLSRRRIVMLGDSTHEFPLPFHALIATLNTWLTMIEAGAVKQYDVTLFLEEDRQVVTQIKSYLKDGNLNPILDLVLPSTTFERLEFYAVNY